jgi:hypothetical protein
MTTFSIFQRDPVKTPDPAPAAIPDRFSWLAALLPPVFAIRHGLWLELVFWLLAMILFGFAGRWIGGGAGFWVYVAFSILIGFEAASLRRGALRRRGWRYQTEIIAPAADLAQVEWLKRKA